MKTPRELAEVTKDRKIDEVVRERVIVLQSLARKRAKQIFAEFPSHAYMTEIEAWCELGGRVELTVKRLREPLEFDGESE